MNPTVLFVYPTSFYRKGKLHNFRNILKFFKPHFIEKGFKVAVVSLDNSETDISDNKKYLAEHPGFEDCDIILIKRKFANRFIVGRIAEFFYEMFILKRVIKEQQPALVYAYGHEATFLASFWKRRAAFSLGFDMRGDELAELKHKKAPFFKIFLVKRILKRVEKKSDVIFAVSDTYIKDGNQGKYIVRYNYYDEEIFHYDEAAARMEKERLGLKDRFVFVYSGTYRYYQMNKGTVKFFSDFNRHYPDSFFLVNAQNEPGKFEALFREYGVPQDAYCVRSLEQEKVSRCQIAADMAFLLREDLVLNHNSFPTKFSEYMASGVPVLMTPHIHTIAPMVEKNRLGEVIELKDDYTKDFDIIYTKYKNNYETKARCARFAQQNLCWQKQAEDIVNRLLDRLNI